MGIIDDPKAWLSAIDPADSKLKQYLYVAVRELVGSFTPSGLSKELKITNTTVTDTLAALPTTALTDRNSMIIFNNGTETIYIGPLGTTNSGVNEGWPLDADSYYSIDITDAIVLYAIAPAGVTTSVKILEVA